MESSSLGLVVRKLSKEDNLSDFRCKVETLNKFLKEDALQAHSDMTSITYLGFLKEALVGFATLAAASIEVKYINGPIIAGYGPKTYPCIKLAKLAIDERFERQDLGSYLLLWTIGKFKKISQEIGCRYLTVDSRPESMGFYEKNDFILVEKTKLKDRPVFYLDMYSLDEEAGQ